MAETQAYTEAEAKANLEFFNNFTSRLGLPADELLAEIRSQGATDEQIQDLITDPETIVGLSQIWAEYNAAGEAATATV